MLERAVLVRVPVGERLGIYGCHRRVYEICSRAERPLWRKCPGYVLVLARTPPQGYATKPYEPEPHVNQVSRFDLLAEVSVAKRNGGESRSRRRDPILEAKIENPKANYADLARELGSDWLRKQGARFGFDVLALERCDYEPIDFIKQQKFVRISAVRFTGQLRVIDPDAFKKAMLEGIGHSKAWGLGLLLCFGS